jgi:hypothetical protein
VVAAVEGTEHRCLEAVIVLQLGPPKVLPAVGDGVPDDETYIIAVQEEHAAVAAVKDSAVRRQRGVKDRGRFFDGNEAGGELATSVLLAVELVVEEAEQGWHSVELAVAAGEARIGEEATPGLADEGGADKALWIFRREAEEDLAYEVVHELRRRHLAAALDRG